MSDETPQPEAPAPAEALVAQDALRESRAFLGVEVTLPFAHEIDGALQAIAVTIGVGFVVGKILSSRQG